MWSAVCASVRSVRLGRLHERVDDLRARLVLLEREAERDDRLLAHARVLLLVVRVGRSIGMVFSSSR